MPSTSQYNPFDQSAQIEFPNDISQITALSVSGNTLTLTATLSTHRSYAASPTVLLLSTPTRGIMSIAVNQQLVDAFGTNV